MLMAVMLKRGEVHYLRPDSSQFKDLDLTLSATGIERTPTAELLQEPDWVISRTDGVEVIIGGGRFGQLRRHPDGLSDVYLTLIRTDNENDVRQILDGIVNLIKERIRSALGVVGGI